MQLLGVSTHNHLSTCAAPGLRIQPHRGHLGEAGSKPGTGSPIRGSLPGNFILLSPPESRSGRVQSSFLPGDFGPPLTSSNPSFSLGNDGLDRVAGERGVSRGTCVRGAQHGEIGGGARGLGLAAQRPRNLRRSPTPECSRASSERPVGTEAPVNDPPPLKKLGTPRRASAPPRHGQGLTKMAFMLSLFSDARKD